MTNTKSTQTFELSDADLRAACAEFIERRFGFAGPVEVVVSVVTRSTAYGKNERDVPVVKVTATRSIPSNG